MLTKSQGSIAKSLFIARPAVLLGTRVILDQAACKTWFDKVYDAMQRLKIKNTDVNEFCDVAGVPD